MSDQTPTPRGDRANLRHLPFDIDGRRYDVLRAPGQWVIVRDLSTGLSHAFSASEARKLADKLTSEVDALDSPATPDAT